jgi:hypothetical protein
MTTAFRRFEDEEIPLSKKGKAALVSPSGNLDAHVIIHLMKASDYGSVAEQGGNEVINLIRSGVWMESIALWIESFGERRIARTEYKRSQFDG